MLRTKAINDKLVDLGNEVVAGDGDALVDMVRRERKLYGGIIKAAGIKAE